MSVFNLYARYYDLLYRDKDYHSEVKYLDSLIKKYKPEAKSVLDLGCGTGRHAFLLAEKGYSVTGVDMSEEMLAVANARLSTLNRKTEIENKRSTLTSISTLAFTQGDIQSVQLKQSFDVVLSLFHVMSYQTTNEMLYNTFRNVHKHLKDGGIFIFDFWYGPAVLTDKPAVREKKLEDEELIVHRTATPVMHPNENVVDVNYEVIIEEKKTGVTKELKETHKMRYLFLPELDFMLKNLGFKTLDALEWMSSDRQLSFDSWYGISVVRK